MGRNRKVEDKLPKLKKEYPNSPSLMFLDGVLTENGQDAVAIYSKVVDYYPYSKLGRSSLQDLFLLLCSWLVRHCKETIR